MDRTRSPPTPATSKESLMDQRFAVHGVDAHSPLKEAAPAILLAKAEPLFELEAAASGGADMDAVHDMRVASRRLRESMRLLAPLYPPAAFSAWYKRVRRVTRALGPVRDSDVFIDAFSRLNRSLDARRSACGGVPGRLSDGPARSRAGALAVGARRSGPGREPTLVRQARAGAQGRSRTRTGRSRRSRMRRSPSGSRRSTR